MTLHLTECNDKDLWDCFVRASPQGNVFCLTPFLDALGEDYDLLIVEDDGEPELGAVMIKRDGQPIKAEYPFTSYQGVLLGHTVARLPQHRRVLRALEVTDFLLAELEKRYQRISFCLHHQFSDLRSFLWFHYHQPHRGQFQVELKYTGLIDLTQVADFDNYLASLRRVRRQEYRFAQTKGFQLEPSTDIDILDRLNELTFKRQGIERDPTEARLLRSIARAALDHGIGELLVCKDPTGFIPSAILTLYDDRCAYPLAMGNDPEERKTGSGIFIFLENFRRYQAKGLVSADFLGINSPKRGDFKTSLGATPVPYFIVTWQSPANCPI
jgi:hypothetical protein